MRFRPLFPALLAAALAVPLAPPSLAGTQGISLFPPCEPFECGDSRISSVAERPATPIQWEEQRVRVEIAAESLLRDSMEHVAVSLMAGAEAFAEDGSFAQPHGPGGGIGVAIGTFDRRVHPACAEDPGNTRIEFAVEQFGWGNPYASTLPVCTSLSRSVLDRAPVLELRLSVRCYPGASCSLNASLHDPATGEALQRLQASGLQLANPGRLRASWFGVTNIQYDDPARGARIRVLDEHYHAEP